MPKSTSEPANRPTQNRQKCFLCKNSRYKDKNCRFFRFPARGTPMWNRWLEALGLTDEDIGTRSNASIKLCQLHFQPKDFLTRQLSAMAIPVPLVECVQPNVVNDGAAPETLFGSSFEYILDEPTDEDSNRDTFEDLQEAQIDDQGSTVEPEPEPARDSCPIQFDELIVDKAPESPKHSRCDVPQHRNLEEQLRQARALVLQLQRKNDYQRLLIQEQKTVLSSLGVQCVIKDESYGESPE
ncbi:uncharacterized protein LOC126578763 [Anopheles aquasalis]|uniref:uncharacterized protein LOC126578763 n=1 Tax=Anopheles aquasalis TaxID=42839 RepID=UPI00215B48AF|nr:uncharacterized protein LOC126578763 [Anopheles aquasalis]